MKRTTLWLAVLGLILPLTLGGPMRAQTPKSAPRSKKTDTTKPTAELQILAALNRHHNWEFEDTPLSEVADYLAEVFEIEVNLDAVALDDVGISSDLPINFEAKQMRLRSALNHGFSNFELTWMIRDEALFITTRERAESQLAVRVYPIADLITAAPSDGQSSPDYDSLLEATMSLIQPSSWSEVGGPCTIQGFNGMLVVSQTQVGHGEVEQLLRALRQTVKMAAKADAPQQPISVESEDDKKLRAILNKDFSADFAETPLTEVVEFIRDFYGVNAILDTRALDDVGISSDSPITAQFKKPVSLRVGLRRILRDLELTWIVHNEALVLTSVEVAERRLRARIYPLGGLIDGPSPLEADSLIQAISSTVGPDSWEDVGGPGTISTYGNPLVLAISQTDEQHDGVEQLLDRLRTAKGNVPSPPAEPVDPDQKVLTVYRLSNQQQAGMAYKIADVARIINKAVDPTSWLKQGGLLETVGDTLVIRTSHKNHGEIEKLLRQLGVWPTHRPSGGGFGGGQGGGGFGGGGQGGGQGGGVF